MLLNKNAWWCSMETRELNEQTALEIASIGPRFVALLIDGFILLIPMIAISIAVPFVGPLFLGFFYKAFFESSEAQATPGKRIMGIKVVTKNGRRIDFATSAIRCLFHQGSSILLCLGHFFALFSKSNQALHDVVADTLVVKGMVGGPLMTCWAENFTAVFGSGKNQTTNEKFQPSNSHAGANTLELIEKLSDLKDRGLISPEEFQSKKQELLKKVG
jgi:uncharacterized RDD family membrane protein YckC